MTSVTSENRDSSDFFAEKSCIVLGATSGLAMDTLKWLAARGMSFVLHGRSQDKLEQCVLELALPTERIQTVVADVTDEALPENLWNASQLLSAKPFGWLCFVGIPGRLAADAWTPSALADIFAINCSGPLLACRHWAQSMKASGHSGNAVFLSTMQACYPFEGSLPYSLGKIALQGGLEILAKEQGPELRINAVAPGVHEAGMALASIQRGKYQPYIDDQRIERYGQPSDVCSAVAFLLQPTLYMTGQTLLLDGGLTLRRDLH